MKFNAIGAMTFVLFGESRPGAKRGIELYFTSRGMSIETKISNQMAKGRGKKYEVLPLIDCDP